MHSLSIVGCLGCICFQGRILKPYTKILTQQYFEKSVALQFLDR